MDLKNNTASRYWDFLFTEMAGECFVLNVNNCEQVNNKILNNY